MYGVFVNFLQNCNLLNVLLDWKMLFGSRHEKIDKTCIINFYCVGLRIFGIYSLAI